MNIIYTQVKEKRKKTALTCKGSRANLLSSQNKASITNQKEILIYMLMYAQQVKTYEECGAGSISVFNRHTVIFLKDHFSDFTKRSREKKVAFACM